jgi:peptidoglycan/LPS O-acetylase OafA/YrhL
MNKIWPFVFLVLGIFALYVVAGFFIDDTMTLRLAWVILMFALACFGSAIVLFIANKRYKQTVDKDVSRSTIVFLVLGVFALLITAGMGASPLTWVAWMFTVGCFGSAAVLFIANKIYKQV